MTQVDIVMSICHWVREHHLITTKLVAPVNLIGNKIRRTLNNTIGEKYIESAQNLELSKGLYTLTKKIPQHSFKFALLTLS